MRTITYILLAFLMLLMGNCRAQVPDGQGDATTLTPQSSRTLIPNIKPSETATPTISPTIPPSFTLALAWTPLPTLSSRDADTKIKELLETNGGCRLPCWWGINPNKTTWAEALYFLSPFISDIRKAPAYRVSQNGKVYTYSEINVYYLTPTKEEDVIWFTIRNEIVLSIGVFPPSTQYKYELQELLSLLGVPKQVYIVAQANSPVPELPPAALVLDYSYIGVVAAYYYVPYVSEGSLFVCPQPVGARLLLDDPTISSTYQYTIEQNVERLGGHVGSGRKIEDVTNMTTKVFYNTFINPTSTICLKTPASLWP